MDLFGDLPPPSGNNTKSESNLSLYDDISIGMKDCPKRTSTSEPDEVDVKKFKVDESCSKSEVAFSLKAYIAERQGEREEMQDAAILLDDCTKDFSSCDCGHKIHRTAFYGVFDGHGGSRASIYAKDNLYDYIKTHFPKEPVEKFDAELKKRLTKAFKETDESFLAKASRETPNWRDGSTASCVLVINDTLYVANIGDSKTVLVRTGKDEKSSVLPLTKDHSPTEYEERQRIQKAGGFVRSGRVQGVLEVSRAFGDARFKKYVTCTPDMTKATLSDNDKYLIIACDGLWKGFKTQEAINYIDNILNDTSIVDIDERFEKACGNVASDAIRRGSSDNVTVVIVRIMPN